MAEDTLANALGVAPLQKEAVSYNERAVPEVIQVNEQPLSVVDQDYDTARKATEQALSRSLSALDEIMEVAKASEHPRAYEVVANMVKTVGDLSETLLKISKARQEIVTPEDRENQGSTNVTNNLIFMSTADMLKRVRSEMDRE